MNELTRQVRSEIKNAIIEAGDINNLRNYHISAIVDKFSNDYSRFDVLDVVTNQYNYFRYGKTNKNKRGIHQ